MENVLKNLREKSILHQDQVIQIKRYIEKKYASSSKKVKATIFANAVHQIVDLSVSKFEEKNRIQIRTEVLKSAIAKRIFEINGYDVFEVCALLSQDDEQEKVTFFEKLTEWINDNQSTQLNLEDVQLMATQVIDQAVNAVILALEETMLVEPEIKQMVIKEQGELLPKSPPVRTPAKLSPRDIEKALSMPLENLSELLPELLPEQLPPKQLPPEQLPPEQLPPKEELTKQLPPKEEPAKEEPAMEVAAELPLEEPEIEPEKLDDFEVAIGFNTEKNLRTEKVKDKEWEELNLVDFIHESKDDVYIRKEKLADGKDAHSLREESRKKKAFQVKVLIITAAVIVSFAMITFLIVGAILVSTNQALKEIEERILTLEERTTTEANTKVVYIVSNRTASSIKELEIDSSDLVTTPKVWESLRYREYNRDKIVAYLEQKDSMLIEKDYLDQLTQISKEFDINPLLLLSIIGQEQGFVPRDHKDAERIINNPFNVYNSWLTYNTDFYSSCTIAARTVISSSQDLPKDTDPIMWINRIYAEDQNWHKGVNYFLTTLTALNGDID